MTGRLHVRVLGGCYLLANYLVLRRDIFELRKSNEFGVFGWWIGYFRGPLHVFERITICGKQIAATFYYTSDSVVETKTAEEKRDFEGSIH